MLTTASAFQGYATLAGLIGFVIFFAIGPGIVVWLAISEVLPLAIRAKGMAVALFANSLMSAILAAVFMDIVSAAGYAGAFGLLAIAVFCLHAGGDLPVTGNQGPQAGRDRNAFPGSGAWLNANPAFISASTAARARRASSRWTPQAR